MEKVAVVLFNLGAPDRQESVQPFLFNLFRDPAIIGVPQPFRWLLAQLISRRRAPVAREIYREMGGGLPLLGLTHEQATALTENLPDGRDWRVFVCMRYWHPMSNAIAAEVKAFQPDKVILLPLYPQYSTTTTGSSLADWHHAAARVGLTVPTRAVCCYPDQRDFIAAHAALLSQALTAASADGTPRVLFSAHGLPKRVVEGGDPYAWQVERTAAAVVDALDAPGLDWLVCYQSRVGPLEWIGPSTDDEIQRAGRDGVPVVVVPIAFVSEHSETLVELDIEYAELAREAGVPGYHRVPALGTAPRFTAALADAVVRAVQRDDAVAADCDGRLCPGTFGRCPVAAGGGRDAA